LQAAYYGLRDIGKVVADFFDVVNQVDKYQTRLG
jgi:hypothetical protein